MLIVIDTPRVGSNPHTRNGRSAWGGDRSLGMGARLNRRQTLFKKFYGSNVVVLSNLSFEPKILFSLAM